MKRIHALLLFPAVICACTQNIIAPRPTTELVESIAFDRDDPRNELLRSFAEPERTGDIVLLGSERMCAYYASALLAADFRDNVDADRDSDGLRDFAGETVTTISDGIFEGGASPADTRDLVVGLALAAVDTTYNVAKYDIEGQGRKPSAKIIVLCEPEYGVSGLFDVDTLFTLTGCGIPVVSPVESALRTVLQNSAPMNIAILGSSSDVEAGVYETMAKEQFALHRARNSEIHAFAADSVEVLTSLLDDYVAEGLERPFDVLIIDDPDVDVAAVTEESGRILSVMCPESVTYGRLLTRGFTIVSTADVLCHVCYDALRSKNLFTFKIAAPAACNYAAVPRPDGVDGGYMIVPQKTYVQDKR